MSFESLDFTYHRGKDNKVNYTLHWTQTLVAVNRQRRIVSTQAVCGGLAHVCAPAAARANSILDACTSHLSSRSCMNNQLIRSRATSQWLPESLTVQAASAHARVQKASATQLVFVLSSARTLRD